MMKITAAIFASLLVLTLAVANAQTSTPAQTPETAAKAKSPAKATSSSKTTTKKVADVKELKIEDTTEGKGKIATKGKTIKVNYTGWLYEPLAQKNRGKQFDTSVGKEPFTFTIGAGNVIKGWDEGFTNMKVGGKRVLTIPSAMGYGERGAGTAIPPGSALVFEVELLDVMETPAQ